VRFFNPSSVELLALYTHMYIIDGMENIKALRWIASSKKDLKAMPELVQDTF
jgi:hypothetical protein